jgi:hypothetical protein
MNTSNASKHTNATGKKGEEDPQKGAHPAAATTTSRLNCFTRLNRITRLNPIS